MRWSDCSLCLGLSCFLTIPAQAQTTSNVNQNQPTTLTVSTKLVVVDIVVTDSTGNAVRGLHAEDFHLTEDGKAQSFASFEESNAVPKGPLAPLYLEHTLSEHDWRTTLASPREAARPSVTATSTTSGVVPRGNS